MVFSNLIEVSGTYMVDLAIEWPSDVVYKLSALLCFIFHGAPPIPYVLVEILNLPHPYLRNTTVLLDRLHVLQANFSHLGEVCNIIMLCGLLMPQFHLILGGRLQQCPSTNVVSGSRKEGRSKHSQIIK